MRLGLCSLDCYAILPSGFLEPTVAFQGQVLVAHSQRQTQSLASKIYLERLPPSG